MSTTYLPDDLHAPDPSYPPVPVNGIDVLLHQVIANDCSDLHLNVDDWPRMRRHGALVPLTEGVGLMRVEVLAKLLQGVVGKQGWDTFSKTYELDTSYAYGDIARFRVNLAMQRGRLSATLRAIPREIKHLEALGMPEVLNSFGQYPRGLVLVTGPTGSGKSTTLASLIDLINRTRQVKIVTVEDPIEQEHQSKQSLVVQREVHKDTASFATALRGVLRQDPDVILIGEMRDYETIAVALEAAETGHLVFGTLHTSSAKDTVSRIINVFPDDGKPQVREALANNLRAVVCQALVPAKDGGRVAAAEIMVVTDAVRSLIRENKIAQIQSSIQSSRDVGSQTRDFHLSVLAKTGKISMAEARAAAGDTAELERLMEGSGVRSGPKMGLHEF